MSIVINTIQGTFIVPPEKHQDLIQWLQVNAVKNHHSPSVKEHTISDQQSYTGRQLITEDFGKEF